MATASASPAAVETAALTVACDGDDELGHPRVFLTLVDGEAVCPYCGRRFVHAPAPDGGG